MDEEYLNSLTVDELKQELRNAFGFRRELLQALITLPEMVSPWLLMQLNPASIWPSDNSKGKELQRDPRLNIPYKSECEGGAGLWYRIRKGLNEA